MSALGGGHGNLSPDVPSLTFNMYLKLCFSTMFCGKHTGVRVDPGGSYDNAALFPVQCDPNQST